MISVRKLLPRFVLILALPSLFCGGCGGAAERNPDETAIRKLVTTYFSSWSTADFLVYRSLFRQNASIALFEKGRWQSMDLAKFLDEQEDIQREFKMEEVPVSVDIRALSSQAAFVEVSWQLKRTPATPAATGKDWFTLVKESQDWKILNLTFWFDAPARSPIK